LQFSETLGPFIVGNYFFTVMLFMQNGDSQ